MLVALAWAQAPELEFLLARIGQERADVKWQASSAVSGDFDGDGRSDIALVGLEGQRIHVAIEAIPANASGRIQYLAFEVSGRVQAAVCTLPVRLEIYPLVCENEGGRLPGCRANPRASGLSLVDDECDSIHMYWDHDNDRMAWWRR